MAKKKTKEEWDEAYDSIRRAKREIKKIDETLKKSKYVSDVVIPRLKKRGLIK